MPLTGTPYYASQADLIIRWGGDTILQWSDVDATGSINTGRVNVALLWADAQIDARFASAGVFVAGGGAHVTTGSPAGQAMLNQWACTVAGVYLYEIRSGRDERYLNNLKPQLDNALEEIRLAASSAKNGFDLGAAARWPVTNAAIGYSPREIGNRPGAVGRAS